MPHTHKPAHTVSNIGVRIFIHVATSTEVRIYKRKQDSKKKRKRKKTRSRPRKKTMKRKRKVFFLFFSVESVFSFSFAFFLGRKRVFLFSFNNSHLRLLCPYVRTPECLKILPSSVITVNSGRGLCSSEHLFWSKVTFVHIFFCPSTSRIRYI